MQRWTVDSFDPYLPLLPHQLTRGLPVEESVFCLHNAMQWESLRLQTFRHARTELG